MEPESPPDRWHQRATLLHEMMERSGVAPDEAAQVDDGAALDRIARRCRACRAAGRCDDWLRHGGDPGERYQFCPNAQALDQLKASEIA